jgi:hypothetical protein
LLSAVLRERVRQGVRAGLVAAAATAGVLVGFGVARREPLRMLNAVAHMVIGTRAYYTVGFDALATPLALALHALSVVLWGVLFAALAGRLRGARLAAAAALLAAAAFLIDYHLVPERFRPGFETLLTTGELAALYAALGASLVAGLRWAAPPIDVG